MTGYINEFNENKNTIIMSLRINDEQLFKKYSKILKKSWEVNENRFWKQPYDKYIKTKIKTYADIIVTNFHNKKMPKEKVPSEPDEKYYPQTVLEECKYVQEKMKFENYIDEELDSDSDNDELI